MKVLLEDRFHDLKFRERFLREARTVAALDHLYIVHVDDFGVQEQTKRAYLVMPFVGGRTFRDVLEKQRELLSLQQVIYYLEQICRALDYAHQRDVVHLDLKPLNLLVHEDGRLLLSDFGLAHLVEQQQLKAGTSLGHGSPRYMAPEHIRGRPDKCSDVYSLGVILYQMLVGWCPFEGETAASIMIQHLNDQPPPLRTFRPELPLELEGILQKALAKSVAQRYQSAGDLLRAFKEAFALAQMQVRAAEEKGIRKQAEEEERTRRDLRERKHHAELEHVRERIEEEERTRRDLQEQTHRAELERVHKQAEERIREAEERVRKAERAKLALQHQTALKAFRRALVTKSPQRIVAAYALLVDNEGVTKEQYGRMKLAQCFVKAYRTNDDYGLIAAYRDIQNSPYCQSFIFTPKEQQRVQLALQRQAAQDPIEAFRQMELP